MSGNELNVSVKPLEWKEIDLRVGRPSMVIWEAKTPFIDYELESVMERPWFCSFICAHFSDLDAAKAACQVDYEQRILSALASPPPPAQVDDGKDALIRELVAALKPFAEEEPEYKALSEDNELWLEDTYGQYRAAREALAKAKAAGYEP